MKKFLVNLERRLERLLRGFNSGELTADRTWKIIKKSEDTCFDKRLAFKITSIEEQIVTLTRMGRTCLVMSVYPEKEDEEILNKTIQHFKNRGFKLIYKDLQEIEETSWILVISWINGGGQVVN